MAQPIEAISFGFHGVLADHPRTNSVGRIPAKATGLREVLQWAGKEFDGKLAIVSSASEAVEVLPFLDRNGLRGAFRAVHHTKYQDGELHKRKPALDKRSYWQVAAFLLNETVERMEEVAGRVAAIEYSVQGAASAKKAGMLVVGIYGGDRFYAGQLGAHADMVAESLSKVPEMLTPSKQFPVAAGGIQ
jgi:phosphoglycolate phosphatase-like HAD superfamily hydrolase